MKKKSLLKSTWKQAKEYSLSQYFTLDYTWISVTSQFPQTFKFVRHKRANIGLIFHRGTRMNSSLIPNEPMGRRPKSRRELVDRFSWKRMPHGVKHKMRIDRHPTQYSDEKITKLLYDQYFSLDSVPNPQLRDNFMWQGQRFPVFQRSVFSPIMNPIDAVCCGHVVLTYNIASGHTGLTSVVVVVVII